MTESEGNLYRTDLEPELGAARIHELLDSLDLPDLADDPLFCAELARTPRATRRRDRRKARQRRARRRAADPAGDRERRG